MLPDDALRVSAVRTGRVSFEKLLFRQIQHDGNAVDILLSGQIKDLFPRRLLYVRRIDYCRFHQVQAFVCRIKEQVKSLTGNFLVVLIVGNHGAEVVGGENLRREKVFPCKGCFSAGSGSDQGHKREFRYFYTHFLNTPI